jgi:hypothetical protein
MDHPITRLSIDNLEEVNAFLLENFFTKEPLGLRLGIDPERDVRPWLSRVTEPLIRQNVSNIYYFSIIAAHDNLWLAALGLLCGIR